MLTERELPKGNHCIHWDGRNEHGGLAGPGVYYARLETNGSAAEARKLIFLGN